MFMDGDSLNDSRDEPIHRIRFMENLMIQVREDYERLNLLWNKIRKGKADKSEIEEILRILSYLKKDLKVFHELKKRGIEGILWGEMEKVEKDVVDKEKNLKRILLSVFEEKK